MSNELFTAFIKWIESNPARQHWHYLAIKAREALDDSDTTEQQALHYFIDMYDSIVQS